MMRFLLVCILLVTPTMNAQTSGSLTAAEKAAVLSFLVAGVHPHDLGTILDRDGIAIRAGHHCCQPLMDRLGVPATARASLALYNTRADIDALAAAVRAAHDRFA